MFIKETRLRIFNDTVTNITDIEVSANDNDWEKDSGPHRNFQNQTINSYGFLEKEERVKQLASNCCFTMTLKFQDDTEDTFKINQKHAISKNNKRDFQHSRKSHDISFTRYDGLLVITVKHTHQQLQDLEAQKYKQRATEEIQKKNYEGALRLLEKALQFSSRNEIKEEIVSRQAEAFYLFGHFLIDEALNLEGRDRALYAGSLMDLARIKLEKAEVLRSTVEHQKALKWVGLKIEGNGCFKEGLKHEQRGDALLEKVTIDDGYYGKAQRRYEEAMVKYEEALRKFEEGVSIESKMAGSVKIVQEQIEDVKKALEKIENALASDA